MVIFVGVLFGVRVKSVVLLSFVAVYCALEGLSVVRLSGVLVLPCVAVSREVVMLRVTALCSRVGVVDVHRNQSDLPGGG